MRTAGGGGGTGVPGSPGAVRAGGRTVAAAGTAVNDTAQAIQHTGVQAAILWSGTAVQAFEAATRALGAGTYAGGDACELLEPVLSTYADELQAAQQDWAAAHADLTAAQSHERAARAADPGDDPSRRDRDLRRAADAVTSARTDMADATQRALDANTRAAGRVDELTSELDGMTAAQVVTAPAEGGSGVSGAGHLALDLFGLIPVVGEPADLVNGVWYAAEGNTLDASLSFAALVPVAGSAATGGKLVVHGADAARGADTVGAARATDRVAGGAVNVRNGVAAENAVASSLGVPRNAGPGRVTYTMPNGQVRVPDIDPRHTPGELVEVKFSRGPDPLYVSDQLRDLVTEARRTGRVPVIYTNRPLRGTLLDLADRGRVVIRPIP